MLCGYLLYIKVRKCFFLWNVKTDFLTFDKKCILMRFLRCHPKRILSLQSWELLANNILWLCHTKARDQLLYSFLVMLDWKSKIAPPIFYFKIIFKPCWLTYLNDPLVFSFFLLFTIIFVFWIIRIRHVVNFFECFFFYFNYLKWICLLCKHFQLESHLIRVIGSETLFKHLIEMVY